MRIYCVKANILWMLALLFSSLGSAQENSLKLGSCPVGFKYEYLLDKDREWIPFPFDSTETTRTKLRPIRLAVWYPAEKAEGKKMAFKNYIFPDAPDSYFGKLNEVMKVYDMWSYNGMFKKDGTVIEKLLNFETNAYFNAPEEKGKFPVVLYCSGWFSRSPDNAIMAEYLASHGYVVVTVPQLGTGTTIFDFKVTEDRVKTQVLDLKFALDHVANYTNVDANKIASSGFSIGGVVALWLRQLDNRVKATVGLDPAFMMKDWQSLTENVITEKNKNTPILSLYRGHQRQVGNVTHDFMKSLSKADKYLIEVPNTTHGEFYDEPYLIDKMEFPWSRPDYNTLEDSLDNFYAVLQITKEFLDHILISEGSSEDLFIKIERFSKEKGLVLQGQ